MLKKYRNQIPELFEAYALTPSDIKVIIEGLRSTFQYKDSPMDFRILQNENDYHRFTCAYIEFSPDFKVIQPQGRDDFDWVLREMDYWVDNHLRPFIEENSIEDELKSWANDLPQIMSIENINFDSEEAFNEEEKALLKAGLNESRELISKEFEFGSEQLESIDLKLNYLIEALERVERKTDWKGLFIATVLNIGTTLALDSENQVRLYQLFSKIFRSVEAIGELFKAISSGSF